MPLSTTPIRVATARAVALGSAIFAAVAVLNGSVAARHPASVSAPLFPPSHR